MRLTTSPMRPFGISSVGMKNHRVRSASSKERKATDRVESGSMAMNVRAATADAAAASPVNDIAVDVAGGATDAGGLPPRHAANRTITELVE